MKFKCRYLIILLPVLVLSGFKGEDKHSSRKININDAYEFIAVNNVLMWVGNNGDGSHDPRTDGNGFYWPGGVHATKAAIFKDGLIISAKVGQDLRVGGSTYREGLQAGKIIEGLPDDPSLPEYRIYKITRGWEKLPPGPERDARKKDFDEWPIEDGAPYIDINNDGKPTPGIDQPRYIGDETLWYVSNDMDPSRTTHLYGTLPMGLEIQTTVYGYNKFNLLGDAVFKKHVIINKSNNVLNDMYIGYWSDVDMGDASDDYNGCDTVLNLGYTYNGTNYDNMYGTPPPAVGYTLIQGPAIPGTNTDSAFFMDNWRKGLINLTSGAFVGILKLSALPYGDPPSGVVTGAQYINNYMQGKNQNGEPIINPHTGAITKYMLSGDPETQTGWYEGEGWPGGPVNPGDRRMIMSSGPVTLAPGDTQEVVYAVHISRGFNNVNSVSSLKFQSSILKSLHYSELTSPPEKPVLHAVPQNNEVLLWWEHNSEKYSQLNPALPDTITMILNGEEHIIPVTDKYYDFEGYQVWQFKDDTGRDPVPVALFDISNGISKIYNYPYELILHNSHPLPVDPILFSPDQGLKRMIRLYKDSYTDSPLHNGSEYYFAVTAYGYNHFSDPPVLESVPEIIKVIPGTPPIDFVSPYNTGDIITAQQTAGTGDGEVLIKIIDPAALTGHDYRVIINGSSNSLNYSLFDITTNKFLIENSTDFGWDLESQIIIDGFQLEVINAGFDSIKQQPFHLNKSKVKDVIEIKGPGGTELQTPVSVFHKLNSTEQWMIKAPGQNQYLTVDSADTRQNIGWTNNLGFNDYEIRFTSSGSQFYNTGIIGTIPPNNSDHRGIGTVPFEIWDAGGFNLADSVHMRHYVKIWDSGIMRVFYWAQDSFTLDWPAIFSYVRAEPYQEPIPSTSGIIHPSQHKLGNIVINGSLPEPGTVIKVVTFKPLSQGDEFVFRLDKSSVDNAAAKQNINNISVFPNPYYAANASIGDYPPYLRFTNLPEKAVIRIFSLGGVYITKLEKDGEGQYIDWDIKNKDNQTIASGIYLAYIELPGIGTKVMKIAVVR